MKKIFLTLLVAMLSTASFAQEGPSIKVSGEVKTGILTTIIEDRITPKDEKYKTNAGSKDDAGGGAGRFRLNVEYLNNNLGFKFRIQWEDWGKDTPMWPYAFGFGNFFDNQLMVSIGKLGASPWGSGGPDMWKELESIGTTGGMRVEYMPSFVSGLNVGFVINGFNGSTDVWPYNKPITFLHVLQESVLGISYTHEFFHVRFAYRLDSDVDGDRSGALTGGDGDELVYRLEERVLHNFLPNFSIGALGYWVGLGADENNKEDRFKAENWLFVRYTPDLFSAQIRFGYDAVYERSILHVKPSFYWNFFDKLIEAGAAFLFGQDFGERKVFDGSPYYYLEIEPKVQLNFASNAYAAFVYNWRREYVHYTEFHEERGIKDPIKQTQWINLRFGIYF